ncbi:hypothetical protein HPB52_003218 [Rhipicephalus sanguineus]|uniref:Uncharacterized protein n=1 Tax=Rhipicephalus sanguineus TaxID=34632 RepID=A0A9D4QA27_RHISA|nr:hypothetical protein HPB52_003218 [Rhipicephalus sanguineus]
MLRFLRVQVEIREKGRPPLTASASSRFIPEEDVQPPPAPVGHLVTASAFSAESNLMARFFRRVRTLMCSKCHRRHFTIPSELSQPAAPNRTKARTVDEDEPRIARQGLQRHLPQVP